MPTLTILNYSNTLYLSQEYIDWLNEHLPPSHAVNDISDSLVDGTLMLKALSVSYLQITYLLIKGEWFTYRPQSTRKHLNITVVPK